MTNVWILNITDTNLNYNWAARLYYGKPSVEQLRNVIIAEDVPEDTSNEKADQLYTDCETEFGDYKYRLNKRVITEGRG